MKIKELKKKKPLRGIDILSIVDVAAKDLEAMEKMVKHRIQSRSIQMSTI